MATEIRFAFALNGGVSLAIWIGGVGDEIVRFIDGGRRAANGEHDDANPYIALCHELGVVPKVDVLTGLQCRRAQRRVPRLCHRPWLSQPRADPAAVARSRFLRPPAAAAHRQHAHLGVERRRQLPAPHRRGVPAPRQERHRVHRRRPARHRAAHGHVAGGPGHHDQRRARPHLVGRPPRRVRVPHLGLRFRRRRQGDPAPGPRLPIDRVVPGGLRAEQRPRRPLRVPPRHRRPVRRGHECDHPGDRRCRAGEPAGPERDRGDHRPAVARARRAGAGPRRA